MDIQQLFQIFLARYKVVVFLFLLVLAAALVVSKLQPNQFTATV
jgi:uncharacterized protein involved in exopolysaccharide biosynthesis